MEEQEYTLNHAKDQVARDLGWQDWLSLQQAKTIIQPEALLDKVAELYAEKKTEALRTKLKPK